MFSISIEVNKQKSAVQTLEKGAAQTLKSSTQKALYRHSKKTLRQHSNQAHEKRCTDTQKKHEKDAAQALKSSTQKTQKEAVFSTYTNQYPLLCHPVRACHSLYLISTSAFSLGGVDEDLYAVRHFQPLMPSSTQVQELYLALRALFQPPCVRQGSLSSKYDKDPFYPSKNSPRT